LYWKYPLNKINDKNNIVVNLEIKDGFMKVADIKKIAVIGGSGMIGSGWVTFFLWKGFDVNVYDINDALLQTAKERVNGNLAYLADKGIITQEAKKKALSKVVYTKELKDSLRDVQFVQECVPEKYEPKQAIVAALDEFGSKEAIFASSTSGLMITEIAKNSKFPERCIGAHPYNPPHLIPLVEISKGDKTSAAAIKTAYDFFQSVGKEPVILQKEAPGFISNRLQVALYREAVDLVLRGVCTVEDVDKALCFGPGLRYALMGPNMIFQLGGGPAGLKGVMTHIGTSAEVWMADMAAWKKWPPGYIDIMQEGVDKEMANRLPENGRTNEEISRWRDDKLLALLKILNKA
jgi:3-hydroxyacyl-CoA dehydrogenase